MPTGLHDPAPTATCSRLAGDQSIYHTLEPSEVREKKDEEISAVPGDADGDPCIWMRKRKEKRKSLPCIGDYNVTNKIN